MMTEAEREKIAHRIRSLLTKTVENGCTEEEALSAAAKARELMDHYRLSMTDIEIQAEPVERFEFDRKTRMGMAAADYCMGGIAKYCGVKVWMNRTYDANGKVRKGVIFGLKSDVEMARYLYELIRGAIHSESEAHKKIGGGGRDAVWSFKVGMSSRINQRLIDMAHELDSTAKTATGNALIVVKNAVVEDAFAKLGLKFGGGLKGRRSADFGAYVAGQVAGNRVNLNRPVAARNVGGYLN